MTSISTNVFVVNKPTSISTASVSRTRCCYADGSKKNCGVIFPSTLKFNTGAPEVMDTERRRVQDQAGRRERLENYQGGESFSVPGNSSFDIETTRNPRLRLPLQYKS